MTATTTRHETSAFSLQPFVAVDRFEQLEAKLVALSVRVEAMESVARARLASGADELAAQRVAEELGFSSDVLVLPKQIHKRRALAEAMRIKGWSVTRIARLLNCSERTVERWLEKPTVSRQANGQELKTAR